MRRDRSTTSTSPVTEPRWGDFHQDGAFLGRQILQFHQARPARAHRAGHQFARARALQAVRRRAAEPGDAQLAVGHPEPADGLPALGPEGPDGLAGGAQGNGTVEGRHQRYAAHSQQPDRHRER